MRPLNGFQDTVHFYQITCLDNLVLVADTSVLMPPVSNQLFPLSAVTFQDSHSQAYSCLAFVYLELTQSLLVITNSLLLAVLHLKWLLVRDEMLSSINVCLLQGVIKVKL